MEIGIDVTAIERIQRLAKEKAFSSRVFTPAELDYARGKRGPGRHLSGYFSAKEAFMKALGTGWTGGISWRDIVVTEQEGRPTLTLSGKAAELMAGRRALLSIACSERLAIATVVITR